MKIWKMEPRIRGFAAFEATYEYSYEFMVSFDGRSHLSSWKPLKIQKMEGEETLPLNDYPLFTFPVFSRKALDCLYPLMKEHIEVLPMDFDEGEYYGINVTTVLNAIDREQSDYITFPDGHKIMMFKKYGFQVDKVKDIPIFKITDEARNYPFVSEAFKDIVEENHLTGFDLKLVWDSEE